MYTELEVLVAEKIRWARQDGCPVATEDKRLSAKMAAVARRRWNSFLRRNKNVPDTFERRVEDLAKGLAMRFEHGGLAMAGGLMSDYRWLCEQLAPILAGDH